MADQNNPAHWCKSVIEQAVQPAQTNPISTWNTTAAPTSYVNVTQQAYPSTLYHNSIPSPVSSYSVPAPAPTYGYPSVTHGYYMPTAASQSTTGSLNSNVTTVSQNYAPSPVYYQQPAQYYTAPLPTTNQASILTYNSTASWQNNSAVVAAAMPSPTTQTAQPNVTKQINQLGQQQIIYQMPHTNTVLGSAASTSVSSVSIKNPNPSRFSAVPAPTTITADQTTSTANQTELPESMKNFIKRSLSSCSESDKNEMTRLVSALVAKVRADNRIFIHNWDLEPIPLLSSQSLSLKSTNDNSLQINVQTSIDGGQNIQGSADSKKRKSRWETDSNGNVSFSVPVDTTSSKKSKYQPSVATQSLPSTEKIMTPEERSLRQQRASRFQFVTSNETSSTKTKNEKKKGKNFRVDEYSSSKSNTDNNAAEFDLESLKIVGTCQTLEKDYFRLTSAPDPSTVRPLDILRKSLQLIKKKWKDGGVEYIYICSQLKAVRQDLTVQNIRNEFMVTVYETHARIALECGDLNEYNQCQTQLKQLYDAGLPGSEMEFTAYRILYYVYLQGNKKYQKGSSDLLGILTSLSEKAKRNPAVIHALKVRKTIRHENYHQFFKLYQETPNMGAFILDHMMDSLRVQVLLRICKAYKPHIPVKWVVDELGFDDYKIGETFLRIAGCMVSEQKNADLDVMEKVIMTAESSIDASAVLTQDKLLL